ncbi:hypothetical protein ACX0G7_09575 [Flavitalea antarctica]
MRRSFTKLAALTAMMGLMAPGTSQARTSNAPTATKEAVTHKDIRPTVSKEIRVNTNGDFLGWRNPPGRFLNQRQYRKKCRNNPSLYKSKKHRSKN